VLQAAADESVQKNKKYPGKRRVKRGNGNHMKKAMLKSIILIKALLLEKTIT